MIGNRARSNPPGSTSPRNRAGFSLRNFQILRFANSGIVAWSMGLDKGQTKDYIISMTNQETSQNRDQEGVFVYVQNSRIRVADLKTGDFLYRGKAHQGWIWNSFDKKCAQYYKKGIIVSIRKSSMDKVETWEPTDKQIFDWDL